MAHIYVNEDLNGDKEAYLILHGENPTARNVRLGITEYIENAWEYNPKLRGKVEKPTDNVTVKQLREWLEMSEKGNTYTLHLFSVGGFNWYLTYH